MKRLGWPGSLFCCLVFVGCGKEPAAPVNTGARDKAREFFEALVRRDTVAAYATLDRDSQARLTRDDFAWLSDHYLRKFGFPATKVVIRFCDEQGGAATAHVLLTTASNSRKESYRESVALKREDSGWAVVLSGQFFQ